MTLWFNAAGITHRGAHAKEQRGLNRDRLADAQGVH